MQWAQESLFIRVQVPPFHDVVSATTNNLVYQLPRALFVLFKIVPLIAMP